MEQEQSQAQFMEFLLTTLSVATILLAADPELPARLAYRFRIWLAHRDKTNYGRLRWMRQQVRAGRWADDRAPETESAS